MVAGLALLARPSAIALVPPLALIAWRAAGRPAVARLAPRPAALRRLPAAPVVARGRPARVRGRPASLATGCPRSARWAASWDGLRAGVAGARQLWVGDGGHVYWPSVTEWTPLQVAAINLTLLASLALFIWLTVVAWRRFGAPYGLFCSAQPRAAAEHAERRMAAALAAAVRPRRLPVLPRARHARRAAPPARRDRRRSAPLLLGDRHHRSGRSGSGWRDPSRRLNWMRSRSTPSGRWSSSTTTSDGSPQRWPPPASSATRTPIVGRPSITRCATTPRTSAAARDAESLAAASAATARTCSSDELGVELDFTDAFDGRARLPPAARRGRHARGAPRRTGSRSPSSRTGTSASPGILRDTRARASTRSSPAPSPARRSPTRRPFRVALERLGRRSRPCAPRRRRRPTTGEERAGRPGCASRRPRCPRRWPGWT